MCCLGFASDKRPQLVDLDIVDGHVANTLVHEPLALLASDQNQITDRIAV